ncbi:hypothetical protein K1719_038379 [Acacia pycnantha]|nr:hypothetical protein K1719_038379 [Acacia pycnantha]
MADRHVSSIKIQHSGTSFGSQTCTANDNKSVLKVFMYDLPPQFHFRLLDWKPKGNSVWPDITSQLPEYPGGLNLQLHMVFKKSESTFVKKKKSSGSPPIEIPASLVVWQSLRRIELKDCHATNVPTSICCNSLEVLHLEHFPLYPDQANSSNPFSSIQKLFGFTKLRTLHLNSFTLSCTGIARQDPFTDSSS